MGACLLAAFNGSSLICILSGPLALAGLIGWRFRGRLRNPNALESFRTECRNCGYNLKGITSPQCPECGTVRETILTPVELRALELVVRRKAWLENRTIAYRDARETDFAGLDREFYDSAASGLIRLGYRPVGDVVNAQSHKSRPPVLRVLAREDGSAWVTVSAVNRRRVPARLQGADLRLCQAQTELADGRFLETSNAAGLDPSARPPEIDCVELPLGTAVPVVIAEHERRVCERSRASSSPFVPCTTIDDLIAAQSRQHQVELAFRRRIGYADPDEVRRLALLEGATEQAADRLAAAVDHTRRRYAVPPLLPAMAPAPAAGT